MHDVKVLRRFVLEVKLVNDLVVGLRVIDDIAPVVVVGENILGWIDEHFYLVAHLDF